MSKTIVAATAAAALLATAPLAQASPFEFGGFYAGAHAGYQESSADYDAVSGGRGGPGDQEYETSLAVQAKELVAVMVGGNGGKIKGSGLMGGLHAGYNYMHGNVLLGVETDISLSGANPDGNCPNSASSDCEIDVSPMATLRPRVGYAADDFLFYATGGVAASRFDVSVEGQGSDKQGVFGWTLGGGVEYLVGDVVGVRLEYRYLRFGDFDELRSPSGAGIDVDMHTIMAGVNWHF